MLSVPVQLITSGNKAGAVNQAGLSMLKSFINLPVNWNTNVDINMLDSADTMLYIVYIYRYIHQIQ